MLSWVVNHSPLLYLTQSLWRDEVYSVFMASTPIAYFVTHLSFEPPFYYLLLHFWMKLFGTSELAGRSLSLVGLTGATVVVIFWAEKLFKKHWLSWWLPVFFFFNPMLLYYGMELRTYGWYIFFATLSLFAYAQKKWTLWTVATILGFYTHSFMGIVPLAQFVHYGVSHRKKIRFDSFMKAFAVFVLAIAPWVLKIALQAGQLKSSWYFPVDGNLVTSVLGNLFVGYEGTPWYLWNYTKLLSLIILVTIIIAWRSKKTSEAAGLFIYQLFLPLILVIGISFIKPFYVNRYMVAVTIAEVFVIALAIYAIRNTVLQKIVAGVFLLFVLASNIWYPSQHAKVDFRDTMKQIESVRKPTDVIIASGPLSIFESMYYAPKDTRVFLYNPQHGAFPFWVGEGLVAEHQMVDEYPPHPLRAFLIHPNGTFDVVYSIGI